MTEYKNMEVSDDTNKKGSLDYEINKEFKKIDKKGRNDKIDALEAGKNVCNNIINRIKSDETMVYGKWALGPLTSLIDDFNDDIKKTAQFDILTKSEKEIHDVAHRINNAENKALERLKKNKDNKDKEDITKKANETHENNPVLEMEKGESEDKDGKKNEYITGNMIFTKAANNINIKQALKDTLGENAYYEIDYSGCTNKSIQKRIKSKTGGLLTTYITYDPSKKNYVLYGGGVHGVTEIKTKIVPKIREGVKLIPSGAKDGEGLQNNKETLGNYDDNQTPKLVKQLKKDMPSSIKDLKIDEQKQLIKLTDIRIVELLKKAKELGYEINTESITKLRRKEGHMELHLTSGNSEDSRIFREKKEQMDKISKKPCNQKLFDFIDSNEGEYCTYITNRIKTKRDELEPITKTQGKNIEKNKENETAVKDPNTVLFGINNFETTIDNYRESEGDSIITDDDKKLVKIKNLLRDARASVETCINNNEIISEEALISNFIDPIRKLRSSIKGISENVSSPGKIEGASEAAKRTYEQQYKLLKQTFLGTKNEQIIAIRRLGGYGRILDNTETSHLSKTIENEYSSLGIEIKNENIQKCLDKLSKECNTSVLNDDGSINKGQKAKYDKIYDAAKKGPYDLSKLFEKNGWLPKYRRAEENTVITFSKTLCLKLKLADKKPTYKSLKDMQHAQLLELENKAKKSEDDVITIQSLKYLESNPEIQKQLNQKTGEAMYYTNKYGNIGETLKSGLIYPYAKLGGGLKGGGGVDNIYNDIEGIGARNLHDQNSKLVGEIISDVAIAAAITIATGGVGVEGVIANRLSRAGKGIYEAAKLSKAVKYVEKAVKTGTKIVKETTQKGGALIKSAFKGSISTFSSNMISSLSNGKSFDGLDPTTVENMMSSLTPRGKSITKQIFGKGAKIINKLGSSFIPLKLKIPNELISIYNKTFGSYVTKKFGKGIVNVTFGYDFIDSKGNIIKGKSEDPSVSEIEEMTEYIKLLMCSNSGRALLASGGLSFHRGTAGDMYFKITTETKYQPIKELKKYL